MSSEATSSVPIPTNAACGPGGGAPDASLPELPAVPFGVKALGNKWVQAAGIAALVFAIYFATNVGATSNDHYVRLADAVLHGRLYLIDAPGSLELVRHGDKAFVINPPGPLVFALPWVALWGLSTNQTVLCSLVGAGAVGLLWVATEQLRWSVSFRLGVVLLVGLGTNLWWCATDGGVWMFAHVSAVFFLMAALVETTGRNRPWLVGILVGMAGLSRLPVFLAFPFFAYTVGRGQWDRQGMVRIVVFGAALAVMGGLYLLWTYGEYGVLTLGYEHGQFADEPQFSKGLFDIAYIPRHIYAILFHVPKYTDEFPYFKPSHLGLGLFFTTPALLYMFRAKLREGMVAAALVSLACVSVLLVTYGVTGYLQFGYRFSLDVLPFMVILAASGMRHRLSGMAIALILLSCAVNLWGTLSFNKLGWMAWY